MTSSFSAMSLKDQSILRVLLYEGQGAQPLDEADSFSVLSALLEKGYAVTRITGAGRVAPADGASLLVLGRFNGAAPTSAEAADGQENVSFQDITGLDHGRIAEVVETNRLRTNAAQHGVWKPWFPVIDYDRCTNCMQCLSFCLFGVYGVDEQQRIQVQNNDHCKTNCPACSRVCPEAAIMFPKYKAEQTYLRMRAQRLGGPFLRALAIVGRKLTVQHHFQEAILDRANPRSGRSVKHLHEVIAVKRRLDPGNVLLRL